LVNTDVLSLCAQLWCVLLLLRARPRPPLALAQLRTLQAAMQGMARGGRALPQVLIECLDAALIMRGCWVLVVLPSLPKE
jgi:hypothetical protein